LLRSPPPDTSCPPPPSRGWHVRSATTPVALLSTTRRNTNRPYIELNHGLYDTPVIAISIIPLRFPFTNEPIALITSLTLNGPGVGFTDRHRGIFVICLSLIVHGVSFGDRPTSKNNRHCNGISLTVSKQLITWELIGRIYELHYLVTCAHNKTSEYLKNCHSSCANRPDFVHNSLSLFKTDCQLRQSCRDIQRLQTNYDLLSADSVKPVHQRIDRHIVEGHSGGVCVRHNAGRGGTPDSR